MTFLRGLWKVLVGIKDALVLLLLLGFFGATYAILSATPHGGGPARGALTLAIDGPIVEQPAAVDRLALVSGGSTPREYRLAELVHALRVASTDPGIEAVALDLDIFAGGRQTAISDLGAEIQRVRAEGKKVIAYATAYDDDTYQLAAQADEVWLNPLGAVVIAGPGGTNLYYAGLLERLGITANIYRVGAFKSAVEPYSRNDMSPRRGRRARRWPTPCGASGARKSPRRAPRRSSMLTSPRPATQWPGSTATWPRLRGKWGLWTGSATGPPSRRGWPSWSARARMERRAASAASPTTISSSGIRCATGAAISPS
jgi:hypothetical protein